MKRSTLASWSAALLLAVLAAAPVHGQEVVHPSAAAAGAVWSDTAADVPVQPLLALPSERAARWGTARSTLVGALAGAVLGSVVFLAQADEECGSPGSMCGLALPLYAGAGALAGGAIGLIFRISTR